MPQLRIATFNLENFDEPLAGERPTLAERIALMRPQIVRLDADIACFQEVNGQERAGQPRALLALTDLLAGTTLGGATLVSSKPSNDACTTCATSSSRPACLSSATTSCATTWCWNRCTAASPPIPGCRADGDGVERPILHVRVDVGSGRVLHVVNVHLKSKIPTDIPGQKVDAYTWRTPGAWAEGSFLSSMKRMSQAVEVRRLVDQILDADPHAMIVVAGDFNATPDEVPVMAIRGTVEDTGNPDLAARVLVPIENTVPESSRYTLFHQGKGQMLDHMLITRNLLAAYRGSEIHNEILHDESGAFATDRKYPESDHAPVVATFDL